MSGFPPPRPPASTSRISQADGDSGSPSEDPNARPTTRQKRTLIESACAACRRRKSKCDGTRPACSRCQALQTECTYEAEEGESRWSALRRRNQILETERAEVRELMDFIQTRPEAEAQRVFQRIRSGGYDDIFSVLRQVRDGTLSSPTAAYSTPSPAVSSGEQRLPPIWSMLDGAGVEPSQTLPILPSANPTGSNLPAGNLVLTADVGRGSSSTAQLDGQKWLGQSALRREPTSGSDRSPSQ